MINTQEEYEILYVVIRDILLHKDVKHISLLQKWTLEMSRLSGKELEEKFRELKEAYDFRAHHENGLEYHDEDPMLIIYKLSIIERIIKIRRRKVKPNDGTDIHVPPIHDPGDGNIPGNHGNNSDDKDTPFHPIIDPEDGDIIPRGHGNDPKDGEDVKIDPGNTPDGPEDTQDDLKDNPEEKQEEKIIVVRVTRRYKDNLGRLLAKIAITAGLVGSIGIIPKYETVRRIISQNDLTYSVTEIHEEKESEEESLERAISGITIGENEKLENGDTLYDNSLNEQYPDYVAKTIGKEYDLEGKYAGDYRVTGFSIVKDGQIIEYIEDFDGQMHGPNLGDFINEVCQKHNLNPDEINVRIHFGVTSDYTRTGWIDVTDLIKMDDLTEEDIKTILVEGETYKGTIHNFTGDSITLDDGTIIKIIENGSLLKKDDIVIGSDGQSYIINNMTINNIKTENNEIIQTGNELDFDLTRGIPFALIPAIAAILAHRENKKRNEEAEKHPKLFSYETEEEYEKAKEEFTKRGEESPSKDSTDLMRRYTDDDIKEIDAIIQNNEADIITSINKKYGINISSFDIKNISFEEGKVIYNIEQEKYDITEIIIPLIASIGQNNNIVAEGKLEDNEKGRQI